MNLLLSEQLNKAFQSGPYAGLIGPSRTIQVDPIDVPKEMPERTEEDTPAESAPIEPEREKETVGEI